MPATVGHDGFPASLEVARAGDHASLRYVPERTATVLVGVDGRGRCSACKRSLKTAYRIGCKGYRFCPACGARIEAEEGR